MTKTATNYTVSLTDGREICFSYGKAVAALVPGRGRIINADFVGFSATTSKHINAFVDAARATELPRAEFAEAIAPVAVNQHTGA